MVSSYEIFEEFYKQCRQKSIEEIIREFGGGEIYIPSYKSTHRDLDIYKRFKEGASVRELAKEYDLSVSRVRSILREQRKSDN